MTSPKRIMHRFSGIETISGNGTAPQQRSVNNERRKVCICCNKETLTCLMLSTIVIGLPIAIIIVLMNLPKLSSRGDTRQQHYIILAFGLPFSLVFVVSIVYAIYRCIMRWKRPADHSKHFKNSKFSWRKFSRRIRSQRQFSHHEATEETDYGSERFYSIVTQVMAVQQQVFPQHISVSVSNPLEDNHDHQQTPPLPLYETFPVQENTMGSDVMTYHRCNSNANAIDIGTNVPVNDMSSNDISYNDNAETQPSVAFINHEYCSDEMR